MIAGGGERRVDGIAAGMGKVISPHAVVFLEVANDGLDGGPPFRWNQKRRAHRGLMRAAPLAC